MRWAGSAYEKHRAFRPLDDAVGHASQDELADPAEAPAAQDDEIGARVFCRIENTIGIVAPQRMGLHLACPGLASVTRGRLEQAVTDLGDDPRLVFGVREQVGHGGDVGYRGRQRSGCDMGDDMLAFGHPLEFLYGPPMHPDMHDVEAGTVFRGKIGGGRERLGARVGAVDGDEDSLEHGLPPCKLMRRAYAAPAGPALTGVKRWVEGGGRQSRGHSGAWSGCLPRTSPARSGAVENPGGMTVAQCIACAAGDDGFPAVRPTQVFGAELNGEFIESSRKPQ